MSALDYLFNRHSTPATMLGDPAPDAHALELLLQAAATAPDHGGLTPWRFIVIQKKARQELGEIFAKAYVLRRPDAPHYKIENYRQKPLRAPMIIVVVATPDDKQTKVPKQEQLLSAGCAAQHLQLAAQILGYGSIWLTGESAYDRYVCNALGLECKEEIIGFIYLGTAKSKLTRHNRHKAHVIAWHSPKDLTQLGDIHSIK